MNKESKQILSILLISILFGMFRYIIKDDSYRFSLVKEPKQNKVYTLPDSLLSPLSISLELAKSIFDFNDGVFIDARDEDFYFSNTIKNSINIPYFLIDDQDDITINKINELSKDDTYIIFCDGEEAGCDISTNLADILFYEYQFTKIYIYEGGMHEWDQKGYPVNEK